MTKPLPTCPICRSTDPSIDAPYCGNPWHRGLVVHFQCEPNDSAPCGAAIDDPPSQLAVDLAFVSCSQCRALFPSCSQAHPAPPCADPACYREQSARRADEDLPGLGDLVRKGVLEPDLPSGSRIREIGDPGLTIKRHRELSDDEVAQTSLEKLQAAYRSLRDHHVAETTALVEGRAVFAKRCDEALAKTKRLLVWSQGLLAHGTAIMRRDEAEISNLRSENARLSEIIDYMQNRYSPLGGRGCALCVYEDGLFIRACMLHREELP
jgi:hypothetical protein